MGFPICDVKSLFRKQKGVLLHLLVCINKVSYKTSPL